MDPKAINPIFEVRLKRNQDRADVKIAAADAPTTAQRLAEQRLAKK